MPVEAEGVAHALRHHLGAGAVEIDPANLAVGIGRDAIVAGQADRHVEPVVGADGDELPAVGLLLGEIVVDDDGGRGIVEIVFDVLNLGDLRQLGDVERTVLVGEPVGPVEAGGDDFHLRPAVPAHDGVDLVEQAGAGEHRALVADAQRTRIGDATRIDLDLEAPGQLERIDRELVQGRGLGRAGDRQEPHRRFGVGTPVQRRAAWRSDRLLGRGRKAETKRTETGERGDAGGGQNPPFHGRT